MNLNHFVKSAFRSIIKNRTFSLINITGLIVGLAVVIILFSWINTQLNFDRFHNDSKQLYLVVQQMDENGRKEDGNATPAPLAMLLQSNFPEIAS
ncbi:MAG: ABC transporter permease, partial [Prolixibacteraceae bacterium]|nr:ABC transporter permease [Prolixibacteraceae bacterium]